MMRWILCFAACACVLPHYALAGPDVRVVRVPEAGIQPQVAVDSNGLLHLVYFKGEAMHGDLFYVRSKDDGRTFSKPIRVNSVRGSAIAIGTIRGAHLALGKNGRLHVAWNGSDQATPKGNPTPMCYARINDAGDAFEPQRNVIVEHYGLDGGGSVAADQAGNVYVAWHAPQRKGEDESARKVWMVRSTDEGKTFSAETPASPGKTGACGCCGMKLFADRRGSVYALYRSAFEMVNRDMYLLRSEDHGITFESERIAPMKIGICVMSSAAFAEGADETVAAWEKDSQIYWKKLSGTGSKVGEIFAAPGEARDRKHPALAVNAQANVLLVWTEGTGWNKGGSLAWQLYDPEGKAIEGGGGKAESVGVWSFGAAFAGRDGKFVVVY